jgi:hypothetical protein
MKIQIDTDRTVERTEGLVTMVENEVQSALGRFEDRLTRVEVHLGDENVEKKTGADKRCLLEARPAGLQPVVVTGVADTIEWACKDAARKMQDLLSSTFGRIDGRDANATIREEEVP